MLGDISKAKNVYIAVGFTDMRMQIDGLAALVERQFGIDPFSSSVFLFCGKKRDRIKVLYYEPTGFILLYKRLSNGVFQWPRSETELKPITWQQFNWLMEGLKIEQKKLIKEAPGGPLY